MKSRLFPALLKYWRGRRGLSQLELSLEADVSSRHLSFLESGRAQPSEAYARGALRVGFLVTVTTFLAAKHLNLDELRIESCFPLDDETRELCARFSREAT